MKTGKVTLSVSFILSAITVIFLLGYFVSQQNWNIRKLTGVPSTPVETVPALPKGSDEGDENIGEDPRYQAAMEKVPEMTQYVSPFGYTIKLMKGWRNIKSMTLDNRDGKREVFSPYSDEEFRKTMNDDPYNPNYYLEVEVRENPKNITLTEWTTSSKFSPQSVDQKEFDTTVNGYPAVKVIGNQGSAYYDYYISANGKVYNPGYFFTNEEQWKSPEGFSLDIFETMIDSFLPAK